MNREEFVFLDRKGRRWMRVRLLGAGLALAGLVAGICFLQALFVRPELRQPAALRDLKSQLRTATDKTAPPKAQKPLWLQFVRGTGSASTPEVHLPPRESIRAGLYYKWDTDAATSLRAHHESLTHICPEMFSLTELSGELRHTSDAELADFARENELKLVPLLTNLKEAKWQSDAVEALIRRGPETQERFVETLCTELAACGAAGVAVDFQAIDPAYSPELVAFFRRLSGALHASARELWVFVPMGEDLRAYDLEALSPLVDRFIAQMHDETSEFDEPGPIASQPWFEGWMRVIMGYGDPSQWVIAFGVYGYDWKRGEKVAETIAFSDALTRAQRAGGAPCRISAPLLNPNFTYADAQGKTHTVWFLDGVTFLNQWRQVLAEGCGGVMINRLGTEDPAIWDALNNPDEPKRLERIDPMERLTHVGRGDFVSVDLKESAGRRRIRSDARGYLTAVYQKYPVYPTLYHQGAGDGNQVALTFDDGPDPEFTPEILDILKAESVPAAFFVVGLKAEENTELLRRIVSEGHVLGNHTFSHANLANASDQQVTLELNATQRLIEWVTGRSTLLFRPPYHADVHPENVEEVRCIEIAQRLGYLTVCESVDTQDWAKPGVEEILSRVREQRAHGNIILFHDAGGDRRQTIAALPKVIEYLRKRGDQIVPLHRLLGLPPEALMPPISSKEPAAARLVSGAGLEMLQRIEEFVWAFMITATVLTVLRTALIALLAWRQARRDRKQGVAGEAFAPAISVVMAAYNEEKVISSTLSRLFDTDYAGALEVIVVDDGSRDATPQQIEAFAAAEPRLRRLHQPNAGKAVALARGVEAASHRIIVFLDADTQFQRDTLRELVQPFRDPRVGAVSGHACVGNPGRWLARFQSLEYVCGFNLDRRAYESVNAITVAPGAISAFRKEAIEEAGGISASTLAEDTDLTLSLHRIGSRIAYASRAIAWTEAPESLAALAKQRFRWAFGTMQCVWKHRDMLLNRTYGWLGWLSLPSILFFQILMIAAVPLVDGLALASLFAGTGSVLWVYFAVFVLGDLLLALLACHLEGERWSRALLILPMRFLYRPLLAFVVWRAILHILKGVWVGWGKLERRGNVAVPVEA